MERAPWWLVGALCVLDAAGLSSNARAQSASVAAAEVASVQPADCTAALTEFRDALQAAREGAAGGRDRLRASAERAATACNRAELRTLANYFLGFDDAELARGLALEERIRALRGRYEQLVNAPEASRPNGWFAALIADCDALAREGTAAAERTVGLRAASFSAWLRLAAFETDPNLAGATRAELAERVRSDLEAVLAGLEATGQLAAALEPRWILGRLMRALGDRARARQCFERCLADAERAERRTFQILALRGLRGLARDGGDVPLEERTLLELARLEREQPSWELARGWTGVLLSADHADEALAYLERSRSLATTEDDRRDWRFLVGHSALRKHDLATAREHLEAALADRNDAAAILTLARLELAEGSPRAAAERVETELDVDTLDAFGTAQRHALLGEAAWLDHNPARARDELFQALAAAREHERVLAASSLDSAGADRGDNVIGEWLGVHSVALLALALVELGEPLQAARVVEEYQSRALRRRARTGADLRELAGLAPRELSTDDVRAWAQSRTAGLLTWVIGPDFGVVLHVAPDGATTAARIELGRAEIAELVRRFDDALVGSDPEWSASFGASLARVVLPGPIARVLASQPDGATLLCLPHGALEPLALERVQLDGRALEERFVLTVLPGLPTERPRAASTPRRWTFLGAPSGSRATPLESARAELEELARGTPGATLALGDACTRAALFDALEHSDALWIATHALRSNEPSVRFAPIGLEVAGGDIVRADEIVRRAGALELVVLSSCASASGRFLDAEGLQGLARAFLDAGARDVIATLRPVADRAAHAFALALHHELASGASRASAVRAARRTLAAKGFPAADWTAFRLLGQD